jgi:hypothetical protein
MLQNKIEIYNNENPQEGRHWRASSVKNVLLICGLIGLKHRCLEPLAVAWTVKTFRGRGFDSSYQCEAIHYILGGHVSENILILPVLGPRCCASDDVGRRAKTFQIDFICESSFSFFFSENSTLTSSPPPLIVNV